MRNKHGLSREIPEGIKRQVRQECGFGCVVCGFAIVEYEHIEAFSECRSHDPNSIALLCSKHHSLVTRGFLGKEEIKRHRTNPITFLNGPCNTDFFHLQHPLRLSIGSNTIAHFECIVRNNDGAEWLAIAPPEHPKAPVRIHATFYNDDGSTSLRIHDNVWECQLEQTWDLVASGGVISLYRAPRREALRLRAELPNILHLERLDMMVGKSGIQINAAGVVTLLANGSSIRLTGSQFQQTDCVYRIP